DERIDDGVAVRVPDVELANHAADGQHIDGLGADEQRVRGRVCYDTDSRLLRRLLLLLLGERGKAAGSERAKAAETLLLILLPRAVERLVDNLGYIGGIGLFQLDDFE